MAMSLMQKLSLIVRSAFLEGDQGKSLAQRCFSASKAAYDLGRCNGYCEGYDDGWFHGKYGECYAKGYAAAERNCGAMDEEPMSCDDEQPREGSGR